MFSNQKTIKAIIKDAIADSLSNHGLLSVEHYTADDKEHTVDDIQSLPLIPPVLVEPFSKEAIDAMESREDTTIAFRMNAMARLNHNEAVLDFALEEKRHVREGVLFAIQECQEQLEFEVQVVTLQQKRNVREHVLVATLECRKQLQVALQESIERLQFWARLRSELNQRVSENIRISRERRVESRAVLQALIDSARLAKQA